MAADICETCSHAWHGLSCQHYNETLGTWGSIVRELCMCPSQYKSNPKRKRKDPNRADLSQ